MSESQPKALSDVVERFLRYVQIPTQSDPHNEGQTPSTASQHDLARMLVSELEQLGATEIMHDEHCYVTASFPASPGLEELPALGLCAHLDTAPDAPGSPVRPHIVHYEGGNLVAGVHKGVTIETCPKDSPYLNQFIGQDIICSDGATLLAADDKAGIAEIMSLLARLKSNPSVLHPCIKVAFVPDEEIGHGASLLDIEQFGARWCYTVDGGELGEFNYECFSASEARITARGTSVHTGTAKNILVNALTLLQEFDDLLPRNERPEYTEGYEGFFHPSEISGNAAQACLTYIVRDHNSDSFAERAALLERGVAFMNARYGADTLRLEIIDQYRNMAESFKDCPFLIEHALESNRRAGIDPRVVAIRGGTDGAQLSFRGLPCPNIATGGTQFHSVREYIPVSALESTVDVLEHLVGFFAQEQNA